MINGRYNTEATYRAIALDSYSSLKDFALDRRKYRKKYILNETIDEKDTVASVVGRVVETLLFEAGLFDDRFYLSACADAPTSLMLAFVEALYDATKEATNEDGEITRTFEELSREAYLASGFKIKYEAVISKFIGSDAEIYYNEIRNVRSKGLTVVTADDVANAEKIVDELKINFVTSELFSLVDSDRYTILKQFQIEGFEIDGHPLKGMVDFLIIDNKEKKFIPYDLKCTWSVENFYYEYYLHRLSYIQAYLYKQACEKAKIDMGLSDYTVENLKFIVCDSINYYNPLIYTLDEQDMIDAYLGFEYNGRKYKGVKQIIEELKFALENGIWNMSKENYINNGIVKIKS